MAQSLSRSVDLNGRKVWCNGTTSYPVTEAEQILHHRAAGVSAAAMFVDEVDAEVIRFNRMAVEPIHAQVGDVPLPTPTWHADIAAVDVAAELQMRIDEYVADMKVSVDRVNARVAQELELYENQNLIPILQACIFVVNRLREANAVWGVGRGSAVASFVLFLIGVHDVDSLTYELDIHEFIGDSDAGTR